MPELIPESLSIATLNHCFRNRQLTPTELTEILFRRIEDPTINHNAFVCTDRESAFQAARASSERWARSQPLGQLDGIPVAIKDVLDVAGLPTRYGSPAFYDAEPATTDSVCVKRLRDQGAIIIGKTRTWEFAWRAQIDRDPSEVVTNPCNPEYSTGGSSSGSAAAVAAGLCSVAIGTDSGGSVRGPAAFCGIVGLKASHGCVPVVPASPMGDTEHIGILSNTVDDAFELFRVIAGYHPEDPSSWPFRGDLLKTSTIDLSTVRLGFSVDLNFAQPDTDSISIFNRVVSDLKNLDYRVSYPEIKIADNFNDTDGLYDPCAALSIAEIPENRIKLIDPIVVEAAARSKTTSVSEFQRLRDIRLKLCQNFNEIFETVDILITLTQESTANRLNETAAPMKLTRFFDLTGQPAISIPAGRGKNGLPVGLQLIANCGQENLLMRVSADIMGRIHAR
jgi:aspartyl-tRNA(Asn)/glutamyl-tRNA(Gln) amidotransferase subunit A